MKRTPFLLAVGVGLTAVACSRDIPNDKLLDILNQRAPLVAHIGPVVKVEVLSTAKAAAHSLGDSRSCEVRRLSPGKRARPMSASCAAKCRAPPNPRSPGPTTARPPAANWEKCFPSIASSDIFAPQQ
jgi:hypothetical protein